MKIIQPARVAALTAISALLVACGSAPKQPVEERPSVATTPHPIFLKVQVPRGAEHLVRVEPIRWWSNGERGGSIGHKTITNGRPYIAFIKPGFVSTDFALVPGFGTAE